jgi:UPF0755 protein
MRTFLKSGVFMKKRKVIKNPTRFGLFILMLIVAVGIVGYHFYNSNLSAVAKDGKEQELVIAKGSGIVAISKQLKQAGLIRNANVFALYCELNNMAGKMKAGKYLLSSSMTVEEMTSKLASGKAELNTVRFTIPEGFELRQIADRLASEGLVDKDKFYEEINKADFDYAFVKDIPQRENKLEGYLFPDTYEIYKNATAHDIIDKMLGRFNQVLTQQYQEQAKKLNMSVDDIIKLASVVEREAKVEKDRPLVSAVFHNRLKKNIKLQSCATVQYLLQEQKEVLTYKDLQIESPYNTYKYAGLPKGPIASPGAKSIQAALYPADVDYLYFVANKDGSHIFTRTYQEHLNAQNKIKR